MEYQANAAASAAFDDIAGMVNRLYFSHSTQAATSSDSSVLDKVGHFFSGLWHKTEDAVEDAYQAVSNEFKKVGNEVEHSLDDFQAKAEQGGLLGGVLGFEEGVESSFIDTLELAAKVNPMNVIQNAILHPEATYEKAKATFKDLEHPVQTAEHLWDGAKVLWSTVKQSFDQDIIHGNAYSRSKWAGYAVGVIAQTIATEGAIAATKGATVVGKGMEMAERVGEGSSEASGLIEINEVNYGDHFTKGKNGRKELAPNVRYVTQDGYKYTTDDLGRIVVVEADNLILKEADRNLAMQRVVGREDRLPDDDGGHLIASQFHGSGDIDNLVAQNSQINRSGGQWYKMESEWAKALKETPPRKVSVKIEQVYSGNSLRPDSFEVVYNIEGKGTFEKIIKNKSGG